MNELAESGNAFLGRYLDDNAPRGFPIDEILLATSLDDLQRKARSYKEKANLYSMWCDEYQDLKQKAINPITHE